MYSHTKNFYNYIFFDDTNPTGHNLVYIELNDRDIFIRLIVATHVVRKYQKKKLEAMLTAIFPADKFPFSLSTENKGELTISKLSDLSALLQYLSQAQFEPDDTLNAEEKKLLTQLACTCEINSDDFYEKDSLEEDDEEKESENETKSHPLVKTRYHEKLNPAIKKAKQDLFAYFSCLRSLSVQKKHMPTYRMLFGSYSLQEKESQENPSKNEIYFQGCDNNHMGIVYRFLKKRLSFLTELYSNCCDVKDNDYLLAGFAQVTINIFRQVDELIKYLGSFHTVPNIATIIKAIIAILNPVKTIFSEEFCIVFPVGRQYFIEHHQAIPQLPEQFQKAWSYFFRPINQNPHVTTDGKAGGKRTHLQLTLIESAEEESGSAKKKC